MPWDLVLLCTEGGSAAHCFPRRHTGRNFTALTVGLTTGDATCACSCGHVLEAIGTRLGSGEGEVLRMRGTRHFRVHES